MKSLKRVLLAAIMPLLMLVPLAYALSPFQTVAGVGGPMPGFGMVCSTMSVSSFTVVQFSTVPVLATNSLREALYVVNISSVNTTGASLPAEVVLMGVTPSTFTSTSSSIAFGTIPGIWLAPHNWPASTETDENVSFYMNGGSTYQGPVYAVAQGTGAVISACEFNP